jgi:hypothetical protein
MTRQYTKPIQRKLNHDLEQWFKTEGKRLYRHFLIRIYLILKDRKRERA